MLKIENEGAKKTTSTLELGIVNREKEINRLKARVDRDGIEPTLLISEYQVKKQKDDVSRFEAQNELLCRENNDLKSTIERLNSDNRSKTAYKQEIESLKSQVVLLEDKVESLSSMLSQSNENLEKLKRMRQEDLRSLDSYEKGKQTEVSDLQKKIDDLESQLVLMHSEKRSLLEEVDKAKRTISAYQSDKRNFASALEKADHQAKEIALEKENKESALEKLREEIDSKSTELARVDSRLQDVIRESRRKEEVIADLHSQIENTRSDLGREKKAKAESELKCTRLEGLIEDQKSRVERLETRNTHLEGQLRSMTDSLGHMRSQSEDKDKQQVRFEATLSALKQELEFIKRDNAVLQDRLAETKRAHELNEVDKLRILSEMKRAEEKANTLGRELESASLLVKKREDELMALQREKTKLGLDVTKLTGKDEALAACKQQIESLNQTIMQADQEKLALKSKIEVLQAKMDSLLENNTIRDAEKHQADQLKRDLEERLDRQRQQIFDSTLQIKQLQERLQLSEKLKGDLTTSSSKMYSLDSEMRRLKEEKQDREEEIIYLKKVIDEKEGLINSFNQEIARLKESLSSEKENSRRSSQLASGLNEQIKKMELSLEEHKTKIRHLQECAGAYQKELEEDKMSKSGSEMQLREANQKIAQLQVAIQSLEQSKESLISKIKHYHSAGLDGDSNFQRATEELRHARQRVLDLELDLKQCRDVVDQIGQQRDEMQFALDDKTEALEDLKSKFKDATEELLELRSNSAENKGQSQHLAYRIGVCRLALI